MPVVTLPRFFAHWAAMALVVFSGMTAAAELRPPLEAFGRLPTLEDMALSPDGTKIAFVKTNGDRRDLLIFHVGETSSEGVARVGDAKLRSVRWIDDDNLLLDVSTTSMPPFGFTGGLREWYQLLTYRVSKHELKAVTFDVMGERTFNVVSGWPVVREVTGAATLFVPGDYIGDRQVLPGLFRFDVASRHMKLVRKGAEPATSWLVDAAGNPAAELVYHDERKTWTFRVRKDEHLVEVAQGNAPIDVPQIIGFSAGGDSILVRFIEGGMPVCKPFVLKDGAWGPPLGKGDTFRQYLLDRKEGRVIGGIADSEHSNIRFFDNELQAHWNAALRAFPNETVRLISHSDDYSRLLVQVFGPTHGYVYAVFDWYTHTAVIVGNVYAGVEHPAEVRDVVYEAADHLKIPAFLTLPNGRDPKNLPLVVLPHGGPAASDSHGFDWWAQALAAQGYAVLQPNYRGSDLSRGWLEAGFNEWGRKMQTDLSDGVRYLAQEGIIDSKRVCIVGASYGGYAALAGISIDPGVYRCAVSVAGPGDLARFLRWTDFRAGHGDNLTQRYWDRFMGVSSYSDPALKAISPIEHVAAVSGPVLVIHGRDDTVVPYEQSDVMADALRHAGKPVDFVTLKHEDHWLSHGATRLEMLEATVAFLRKNNPPDP